MIRAAEFENLDRASARLVLEHVSEHHHIVGDEFLDAETRYRPIIQRALSGEQRGDAHSLERRGDAKQLASHDGLIGELRKHRAERIDGDSLRVDLLHGVLHAGEQRPQIERAAFDDLHLRIGRGIDERELSLALPLREIPSEASHVRSDVRRGFLERHEHRVLVCLLDPRGEKLHGKYGLPASRGSRQQRRAVDRQSALRDHVEAGDSGWQLSNGREGRRVGRHESLEEVDVVGEELGLELASGARARTSRPSRTFSVSDKLPISRRQGGGTLLMSVGVARIFSSSASCGFSSTSMICSSYWPASSCSQILRRFITARSARGFDPVTYSLSTY